MRPEKKTILREDLKNQLDSLKGRAWEPDAAHWRKLGKLAQDFTVWLEKAKPWISCASNLIALRVEQVMGEVDPQRVCGKSLQKLADLLDEAGRQLAYPGQPIQVLDLENGREPSSGPESCSAAESILLPSDLVAIPEMLRPEGNPAVQFLYIIPN